MAAHTTELTQIGWGNVGNRVIRHKNLNSKSKLSFGTDLGISVGEILLDVLMVAYENICINIINCNKEGWPKCEHCSKNKLFH